MQDPRTNEIRRLQDEIRQLVSSEENKRRVSYWARHEGDDDYIWHPTPKPLAAVPFTIEFERVGFSQILGFSVVDFYTDPVSFVLESLRIGVWKFRNIPDCTPIGKGVTYWPGVGFEKSLFGVPQQVTEEDAWVGRQDAITERVPPDSLGMLDFERNPVIRQAREFHQKMLDCLDDDFPVSFPQWCRSPWGVAWHLRGIDNLLIDIFEDPEWVRQLLVFLTEARIRYAEERARSIGKSIYPCNIYNDEVTSPVVSPDIYRDLILPTEIELSRRSGGVSYWHSCGNTTVLQELIDRIPDLHLVHVSPWTDLAHAEQTYSTERILEFVLHPVRDVLEADAAQMTETLRAARETVKTHRFVVRADGFEFGRDNLQTGLERIRLLARVANETLLG